MRFQDAVQRDLCIESGIIDEGSMSGMVDVKIYNRIHKYIYEALMCMALKGVITWMETNHQNEMHPVASLME